MQLKPVEPKLHNRDSWENKIVQLNLGDQNYTSNRDTWGPKLQSSQKEYDKSKLKKVKVGVYHIYIYI